MLFYEEVNTMQKGRSKEKMADHFDFLSEDDPACQVMRAQQALCDLEAQEDALYTAIGREAYQRYGAETFKEQLTALNELESRIAEAKTQLDEAVTALEERKIDESRRVCLCVCTCCGYENPDGTKYCERCGAKLLEWEKLICLYCGAELLPNALFCGQCGNKL